MPGKLPIDRVRAAEDAPRIYAEEKERFTQNRAERRMLRDPKGDGPAPSPPPAGVDDPPPALDTAAADGPPPADSDAAATLPAPAAEAPHA